MAMRKLGRPTAHRKAMLRGMVTHFLENERMETTITRAKELRSVVEKIITTGKKSDLHSKRQVYAVVTKEDVSKKLFDEIAPRYADRNGGYTRIIRIGPRRGDAAEMAIIEFV
ncbi:MAG: 50S ribosomal protein L17 [Oscillospiraceae bacterium]|nr:50S ribosomal protein L17 [Oscillospiraceae bacterium]